MNITPKDNNDDFNHFLFNKIDLKLYKHKFLNDYLQKAKKGISPLYDLSVINTTESGWILIIHGDLLLIYGENWSEKQFHEISEVFNLNNYTNFAVAGDDKLIEKLIEFYRPKKFKVEKRRTLYQANEIIDFNPGNLKIKNGSLKNLNELSVMLQEYYHEEYKGHNDKTIKEMQNRITSVIKARKIFVLFDESDNILSFCTLIDPDIGIMFTKREYRGKGYGKIILSYCSKLLLEKNEEVYLMTDTDEIQSNVVCKAVGFKPFYSYTMTEINRG